MNDAVTHNRLAKIRIKLSNDNLYLTLHLKLRKRPNAKQNKLDEMSHDRSFH